MQSPWVNDAEFIGYFVAINQGYYKDAGLSFQYLSGGPEIIAEGVLMSKRAEIALAPVETVVNLIVKENAPLRIIGTQYQKSPLGIVSLEKNNIRRPSDLVGKRLAAPAANVLTVEAFLKKNNISKDSVKIVPYQYDPSPLLNGEVDATVDFVTNVPFTIRSKGGAPTSFLFYDNGFPVYNDVVVVRLDTLKERRDEIKAWFTASRNGWKTNFSDPEKFPRIFMDSFFSKTGRTVENEIYFNKAQRDLIVSEKGIFAMEEAAIVQNIDSLNGIGIRGTRDMFDTSVINEIKG